MAPHSKKGYVAVDSNDEEKSRDNSILDIDTLLGRRKPMNGLKVWLWTSTILNFVLALLATLLWIRVRRWSSPLPAWPATNYSPAHHIVEYESVTFNDGFKSNSSIYMGPPTDESDSAWEDLWETMLFAEIDVEQASHMPGRTVPIPNTGGLHMVGLDVFHQLHCLNAVRKYIRPERYNKPLESRKVKDVVVGIAHIDHCVESLRQSLMCSADLTPVSWVLNKTTGKYSAGTSTHTCRKWDRIVEWANTHKHTHLFESGG